MRLKQSESNQEVVIDPAATSQRDEVNP